MRIVVSILLCSWLIAPSFGAIYYVDPASGADSNNGTSKATAWKHSPGDLAATSNAAAKASTLAPGDEIHFHGGIPTVSTGRVEIRRSGLLGLPIIYDGISWSGTNAVIDRQYTPNTSCFATTGARSNFVIRGFTMQHAGGYATNNPALSGAPGSITAGPYGGAISSPHESMDWQAYSNTFREIGYWYNVTQNFDEAAITGVTILMQANKRVTIHKNVFKDGGNVHVRVQSGATSGSGGTSAQYTKDVSIVSNDFSGPFRWGIDLTTGMNDQGLTNITVAYNRIHDYHEFDLGNWVGFDEKPHTDGIIIRNNLLRGKWSNVRVYSNRFYSDIVGASQGGTASIFITTGPSALIYNNLFSKGIHAQEILIAFDTPTGAQQQNVYVFNNTFSNVKSALRLGAEDEVSKRRVYVANNILRLSGNSSAYMMYLQHSAAQTNTLVQLDYNIYTNKTISAGSWLTFRRVGTTMNLSGSQSLGYESFGYFGDPRLADADLSGALADLTPATNSVVLATGTNLTAFFTTDYHGSNRVSSGPWTIGALLPDFEEEVEPDPDTDPPTPDPLVWVLEPFAISSSAISMSWTNATDASGAVTYIVTEYTGNPGCDSFQTTDTTYTDTGINPSTPCQYDVFASDVLFNSGDPTPLGGATTFQIPSVDLLVTTLNATTANITPAPVENLLLDEGTNAAFVAWNWSRRMSLSYGGAIYRVQRSSDGTEQDIEATSEHVINTNALLSFVGTTSADYGRVTITYDQSGNNRDISTSSTNLMPLVVAGGVLIVTSNGVPCARFDGANDRLIGSAQTQDIPFTGLVVVKARELPDEVGWIGGANSAARVNTLLTTNRFAIQSGAALFSDVITTNTFYQVTWNILSGTSDYIQIDDDTAVTGTAGDFGFSSTQVVLGHTTLGAAVDLAEFVIFPATISGEELERLRANQEAYFGL